MRGSRTVADADVELQDGRRRAGLGRRHRTIGGEEPSGVVEVLPRPVAEMLLHPVEAASGYRIGWIDAVYAGAIEGRHIGGGFDRSQQQQFATSLH
ncbi:hypothetical protein WS62_18525 [Burkholderia sp. ABCPW 14]|nr:hypothetical protein WS62_18525 [Burkholderia sp. ABCPW 14]